MIDLGIKQKDMCGTCEPKQPAEEKDWENEVVYPEVHVSGKLAEKMGAADLDDGEEVKTEVVFKVKRLVKTTANGVTEYSMDLCITKMGDELEQSDNSDEEGAAGDDSGDDGDMSGDMSKMNATRALGSGY